MKLALSREEESHAHLKEETQEAVAGVPERLKQRE